MRNRLIILLLLLSQVSLAQKDIFQQANEAYRQSDYKKATELYQQVEDRGEAGSAVYYNLGNAFYRQEEYTKAIYYFEKALKFNPGDEDIIHNLKIANKQTVDKIEVVEELSIATWYESFVRSLHSNAWAGISLLLFVVGFSALFLLFVKLVSVPGPALVTAFVLSFSFSVLTFTWSVQAKSYIEKVEEAILFEPTASVYSEPNKSSSKLFVIHEGLKVEVKMEESEWVQIKLADGNTGWVPADYIKKI